MAQKKRPSRVRPKSPARVRKKKRARRKGARGNRDLLGLGLLAAGLFLAVVTWLEGNGGIVETLHRHVEVDCESRLCRGRTVVDLWHRTGEEPNADVGVGIDADAFLELLCERVSSL